MRFIADFHLHSKFSRATSKEMEVETLAQWAKKKGINTSGNRRLHSSHLFRRASIKIGASRQWPPSIEERGSRSPLHLTTEVCNIYTQSGRVRRIHHLIFAPNFEVVETIRSKFGNLGKLSSDGRPIFSFGSKELSR